MDMAEKRKLQYITLIWEELPECVKIFIIPRSKIEKKEIRMLRACHRNYINAAGRFTELASAADIDKALVTVLNMITDPEASWITDEYIQHQADQLNVDRKDFMKIFGKWSEFEIVSERPHTIPRSKMYRSGFLT
jgi:hypothetical protein